MKYLLIEKFENDNKKVKVFYDLKKANKAFEKRLNDKNMTDLVLAIEGLPLKSQLKDIEVFPIIERN